MVRRIVPVLALAALLAGCTAKPENSPVIRKKFAEVDELKTSVDKSGKQLEEIASQLALLRDDVSNLRALAPGADGAVEVVTRLEQLEKRLNQVEGGKVVASVLPASNKDAAAASLDTANGLAVPKSIAATTEVKEAKKEVAQATTAARKTTTSTTPKATAAASKPAASAPRGKYYTIQAGDTLDKIAKDNGISVSTLAKENRLPAGATPLKGQRIFVPGK